MKERNNKIDFIKGLAILLVIWGHCIQYFNNKELDFFLNPIFIFIYSFHMPLFMSISGFLFFNSVSRSKKSMKIINNKIKQIVIPIISWSSGYYILTNILIGKKFDFLELIISYISGFWFLYTLFILSMIVVIIHYFFYDKIIIYMIVGVLLLFFPEKFNFVYIKFMYPYFILGYFFNKYSFKLKKSIDSLGLICIILFLCLLLGWQKDFYIYTTGMSLYVENITYKLIIILYRFITGLVGSISIIYIMYKLYIKNKITTIIEYVGKLTMGIYIIQTYIFKLIYRISIPDIFTFNMLIYNFILTPILGIFIVFFCINIIKILQKNKYFKSLFLG